MKDTERANGKARVRTQNSCFQTELLKQQQLNNVGELRVTPQRGQEPASIPLPAGLGSVPTK